MQHVLPCAWSKKGGGGAAHAQLAGQRLGRLPGLWGGVQLTCTSTGCSVRWTAKQHVLPCAWSKGGGDVVHAQLTDQTLICLLALVVVGRGGGVDAAGTLHEQAVLSYRMLGWGPVAHKHAFHIAAAAAAAVG
jgi:hypothetical protein